MNDDVTKITDVVHGTIYLSEIEKEIISTPLFNRLHYVSQTSTVYLTYPSNNSKRFDHCIGTMKLCGDIFYYSVSNAEDTCIDSLMKDLKKEISSILKSWKRKMPVYFKESYGDENLAKDFISIEKCNFVGGIYKQFIPTNIEVSNRNYYILLFEAIRVAGLLHDIGHPPFSHIVENGLKSAYCDVDDSSSLKKSLKVILKNGNELHEEIGNVIFEEICHSVLKEIKNMTLDYRFFYILVLEMTKDILGEKDSFFRDIHRIVSGSLDGDRLDNINRDSFMTGFDKNLMDYTKVLNSMILIGNSSDGYMFCPNIKVLVAIEECFSKRWKNYRCMTHHHRVIKTNYMLQMIIYYLSLEYTKNEKGNSHTDSLFLPYDISGLWEPILETASTKKRIIRFIQWNDNWLMTILQKKYLEMFLYGSDKDKDSRLYYFLEELIENKKNYNSLIKRYEDYIDVDKTFEENFKVYLEEISNKYTDFNNRVKAGMVPKNSKTTSNITGFINGLLDTRTVENDGSFLTSKISYLVSCFLPKTNIFDEIGTGIEKDFYEKYKDIIGDCFLVSKKLKTGTDNLLCLYDTCVNNKKRFIDISHIDESLKLEQSYIPEFYIYIKWHDKYSIDNATIIKLRKELGKIVANHTKTFIENNFMKYLQIS